MTVTWGAAAVEKGVVERDLVVDVDGRHVPAVLWTPEAAAPGGVRPLVVLGHGRSLDKRIVYLLVLARRLCRHHGIAALSLDWPGHGDRTDDLRELADATRAAIYNDPDRIGPVIDDAAADVAALVSAVRSDPEAGVGEGPLGWFGLSLGTMLGLPSVAADDRYRAAVLGLMGLTAGWSDRLEKDARSLTVPTLFLQQWDDELIGRSPASKLFDAIGTTDKSLHANPGAHAAVPPHELDAAEAFLAARLLA